LQGFCEFSAQRRELTPQPFSMAFSDSRRFSMAN